MKKNTLILILLCIIMTITIGCGEKKKYVISSPDKIIIYKEGIAKIIDKNDSKFNKIIGLINKRFDNAALSETLAGMRDGTLSDIKNNKLSIEFIFSKEQTFDYEQQKFKYTKLFFPLQTKNNDGQDSLFYYALDDNYTFPLMGLTKSQELIDLLK